MEVYQHTHTTIKNTYPIKKRMQERKTAGLAIIKHHYSMKKYFLHFFF